MSGRASRRKIRSDFVRRFGALYVAAMAPAIMPARAQLAPNAAPTGGQVAAGSAAIAQAPGATVITQSSGRAAINWQSFNVGAQHQVDFVQPSASALTLNRVGGMYPSEIAGSIRANGQLVIINQNGIVFDRGSEVNAAALVATSADIANSNFMQGRMIFNRPGNPNAAVRNEGVITVRQHGLAALVAPVVANSGVITAKLGHVVLAGATAHTVDLYGDGLLSINITGQVRQVPLGPDGKPVSALVTNSGLIRADGGTVTLTARAVDGLVQNLVDAGGTIAADTVGGHAGRVVVAGDGGALRVDGTLSAQGIGVHRRGGEIELAGSGDVALSSRAVLDASGGRGGGVIAVGTTLARAKGGRSAKASVVAANVKVARGAIIRADATASGDGGRVTVLSQDVTSTPGTISVRGKGGGGNGGSVEISGGQILALGWVDASAPHGPMGSILIDPGSLVIADGGKTKVGNGGTITTDTTISPVALERLRGAISLVAEDTIDILSAIDLKHNQSLSLEAMNVGSSPTAFEVAAPVSTVRGGITFIADSGAIVVRAPIKAAGSGSVTLTAKGGNVELSPAGGIGGSTTTISSAGTIFVGGAIAAQSGSVVLTAQGDVTETPIGGTSPTGSITAARLSVTATNGAVSLDGASNQIGELVEVSSAMSFDLIDQTKQNLIVQGATSATGAVTIGNADSLIKIQGDVSAAGSITLNGLKIQVNGNITSNGGAISLSATNQVGIAGGINGDFVALQSMQQDITEFRGGSITAATLTATAANGSVHLASANNAVEDLAGAAVSAAGVFQMDDGGLASGVGLTVSGVVKGGNGTSGAVTISAPNSLVVQTGGAVEARKIVLTAGGSLEIDGHLSGKGIDLTASGGNVTETPTGILLSNGNIIVSAAKGDVSLDSVGNNIIKLAGAMAGGSFVLTDQAPSGLVISGTIGASKSILIDNKAGGVTQVAGTISAPSITLEASGTLAVGATISAESGGTVTLQATGGDVTQVLLGLTSPTGLISAGTLAATATGSIVLTSSANSVTDLAVGSAGASFTLIDQVGQLDLTGRISADTVSIKNNAGGVQQTAGTISASSAVTLTANGDLTVGVLQGGSVSATTSGSLTISDPISVSGAIVLSGGTVSLDGNIVSTEGGVSISSTDTLTFGVLVSGQFVTLVSSAGDVSETATGALSVIGGLTVKAANGSVSLVDGVNNVATLAAGAAGHSNSFAFTDAATGGLTIAGQVSADTVSITSAVGGIQQTGSSTISGSTVTLDAQGGDIVQAASAGITAGTLLLSLGGSIDLEGVANAYGAIGVINKNGSVRVVNHGSSGSTLEITGAISGTSVFINDGLGTLLLDQPVVATDSGAVTLKGGNIEFGSTISGGILSLDASGDITETLPGNTAPTGTLLAQAGTLAVSAGGAVWLNGSANDVANLGSGSASGVFVMMDQAPSVSVGGPLTVNGGTVVLSSMGRLSIAGLLSGADVILASTAGSVAEAPTGGILAGWMSASAAGSVVLDGTANMVGNVGGAIASASGSFALVNRASTLTISGRVSAGTVAIANAGAVSQLSGDIQGSVIVLTAGGGLTQVAGGIGSTAGTSQVMLTGTDGITLGGAVAGGTVTFSAISGSILEQPTAAVLAGSLAADASGAVTLGSMRNEIASVQGGVSGGQFVLVNAGPAGLTVSGSILSTGGDVTITTAGQLAVNGSVGGPGAVQLSADRLALTADINGSAVSLVATSGGIAQAAGGVIAERLSGSAAGSDGAMFTGTNRVAAVAGFSSNGVFLLNNTGSLLVSGSILAAGQVRIADVGGQLMLSGPGARVSGASDSQGGAAVSLTAAGGNLVLAGGSSVTALGPAGAVFLAASGSMTLAGQVSAQTSISLQGGGNVTEVSTSVLDAFSLTGSASGNVNLAGANHIRNVTNFAAGGSLILDDQPTLLLQDVAAEDRMILTDASSITADAISAGRAISITTASPLTLEQRIAASTIVIDDPDSSVLLLNTTIVTGTAPIVFGPLRADQWPTPSDVTGVPGMFILAHDVTQIGTTVVQASTSAGALLRVDIAAAGMVNFNDLEAPSTSLFLNLTGPFGFGTGVVQGQVDVGHLYVQYDTALGGAVSLTGRVAGVGGELAAGQAYVTPLNSKDFAINGCPLGSVNCVLLSPLVVPVTNPVTAIDVTTTSESSDDVDLILPNIGETDY